MFVVAPQTFAQSNDGAADLGGDYAFLFLMTMSPDFAAANYTIQNETGPDVNITIGRLPYHIDLAGDEHSRLTAEIALAYQQTEEVIPTFQIPGEYIDASWKTAGGNIGLIYERKMSKHLSFTPSFLAGIARMENKANYFGTATNLIKDTYEGTLLNWQTDAGIYIFGLGVKYDWKLLDRSSSIKADVHHAIIDSFNEDSAAQKFTEQANMASINGDMLFPTDFRIHSRRLDLVLMLGANHFFGQNRRTLGYTTSYQLGAGGEFPLKWREKIHGYVRLSGQVLWAENMDGWMLTVGYNKE